MKLRSDRVQEGEPAQACSRARRWEAWILFVAAIATSSAIMGASTAYAIKNCPMGDPDCGAEPPEPKDGPNDPPYAPQVRLTARAKDSITVSLIVPNYTTSYMLQRSAGGSSSWTTVFSQTVPGATSRVDSGLAPDTSFCYRLQAKNSHGTTTSPSACAFTKDGRDLTAFRVQVRLETGDVDDAGTDDDVAVSISGGGVGSVGGMTWLDHGRDDFERNDVHNYDLVVLDGIEELGDIHSITISKFGDDDWCLKGFTLLVDGRPAFSSHLNTPCQWFGNGFSTGITATHAMLRADPAWSTFSVPLPDLSKNADGTWSALMTIPRQELEERIESMVGHSIHGTEAYWGHIYGRPVEVTPWSSSVVNVDLDLAADVFLSDPEVDVDFQIWAGTHKETNGNWDLDLQIQNVQVDVDLAWWEDLLDVVVPCGPVVSVIEDEGIPFCLERLAEDASEEIEAGFPRAAIQLGVGSTPLNLTATFDGEPNLNVVATLSSLGRTRFTGAVLQAVQPAKALAISP